MSAISLAEVEKRMGKDVPWDRRLVVETFFSLSGGQSAAASLDFHLGNRFAILRRRRDVQHDPVRLGQRPDVYTAQSPDIPTREFFVSFGDQFVIHPGHLVLGTTLEWFRFPPDLMAYVVARSIWGRRGLLIATATAVHPDSPGTITLELSNTGELAIILKPGVRIGRLFFHQVDPADQSTSRTKFASTLRPVIGLYSASDTERFLLEDD